MNGLWTACSSVSYLSDKSMFGKVAPPSTVAITVGGASHEVDFWGEEKSLYTLT